MAGKRLLTGLHMVLALGSSEATALAAETSSSCQNVKVAIIGAGISGIGAAKELSAHSVNDFVILEHNNYIGGRIVHANFGVKDENSSYVVELGANWIHGRQSETQVNPVWALAQKYNLKTRVNNNSRTSEFDKDGRANYLDKTLQEWEAATEKATDLAEWMEKQGINDTTARAALRYAGWNIGDSAHRRAVEWNSFVYSNAMYPEDTSLLEQFGDASDVGDDEDFGSDNNLVIDTRGYNYIVKKEAEEIIGLHDPRLRLRTTVTDVKWSDKGVILKTEDGSCIHADYAISTVSNGVLQQEMISFSPELPMAKRLAIASVNMGIYTKIFLQFNENFWGEDDEFLLYADETRRGYYAGWQSLSLDGFFRGSNIIFATLSGEDSRRVERQSDEETQAEMMQVLRTMFPDKEIPEPLAIMYPRWGQMPWVYGSYSSMPPGFDEDQRQALRENAGRLYFAGEAVAKFEATTHGAWMKGMEVGREIAKLLQG